VSSLAGSPLARRAGGSRGRISPKLRGFGTSSDEDDAHWILRQEVLENLALVQERELILELPCVYPRHLGGVPELQLLP
jgi:hypothetical protein